MNSVTSQVDPFDGDVENVDYVNVVDPNQKYKNCQRLEAPAPELTILRYSDDGINHQLEVTYSEAHPWSVSGGYTTIHCEPILATVSSCTIELEIRPVEAPVHHPLELLDTSS